MFSGVKLKLGDLLYLACLYGEAGRGEQVVGEQWRREQMSEGDAVVVEAPVETRPCSTSAMCCATR